MNFFRTRELYTEFKNDLNNYIDIRFTETAEDFTSYLAQKRKISEVEAKKLINDFLEEGNTEKSLENVSDDNYTWVIVDDIHGGYDYIDCFENVTECFMIHACTIFDILLIIKPNEYVAKSVLECIVEDDIPNNGEDWLYYLVFLEKLNNLLKNNKSESVKSLLASLSNDN